MSYASAADLATYAGTLGLSVPAGGDDLLAAASRDLDVVMGRRAVPVDLLVEGARTALARATCAQACFRSEQGGEAMLGADDGIASLAGISFTARSLPRVSPMVFEELAGWGLILATGTVSPDPAPVSTRLAP